ncbi:MAG: AMP-binding protein [Dehalococcoidia bacterium]|nr:AMP-binding protein [Dehalococcoidia bacterium]
MNSLIAPQDPKRNTWSMTLGEVLALAAERNPNKVYLYHGGRQVTYRQLLDYSLQAASAFRSLGVAHGDRVGVYLPNCREFLFSWMGLSLLGAICVPINTAYRRDEMAYILNNAEVKGIVCNHTLADVVTEASPLCPSLRFRLVVGDDDPSLPSYDWFQQSLEEAPLLAYEDLPAVAPTDLSMLVYTSGTTGRPKGVMISHEMYIAAGQGFAVWPQATENDRFFTCLPYFHANAQYYSTMGSLAAGASLVLEERFSASNFWQQIRSSDATVVNFIGMMMSVLLKQPPTPADGTNSVRLFYGSPAMDVGLLKAFEERFGARVIIGFGMTETCYGTIEGIASPHRPGSSGRLRWHPDSRFENRMCILGPGGASLGEGQVGEILLRNPAVTPGYWRDESRTTEALQGGWLHTGDLGWVDDDGYLFFVDRKKDVVRRRGENISSQEVEDVIKAHPKVLDCAVIAVPSDLGEEEVKAYVVPRPTESMEPSSHQSLEPAEVVYWCAEHLAYFKVPRYVELRQDLPRTPSLRVRKDVLRDEREDLTQGCFDREASGIQIRRPS